MKQPSLLKATFAIALALCAHAYLEVEEGALNVRHIHMVERAVNGEIGEYNSHPSTHFPNSFTHFPSSFQWVERSRTPMRFSVRELQETKPSRTGSHSM
jgi:hypothetical protein